MKRVWCISLTVSALGALLSATAQATSQQSAVCSGAGTAHNPNFGLRCTVGQPIIGSVQGPQTTHQIGLGYIIVLGSAQSVNDPPGVTPGVFHFTPNHPNPFRPYTTLSFDLPRESHVSIVLYNPAGQAVRTAVDRTYAPGSHSVRISGATLPSGLYFCRMTAGEYTACRKMMVLK